MFLKINMLDLVHNNVFEVHLWLKIAMYINFKSVFKYSKRVQIEV